MTTERGASKEDLRTRLIEAAARQIIKNGLRGLKARDVTAEADCALYTVFEDLDRLILAVNSRTLHRPGAGLAAVMPDEAGPKQAFLALAQGYVDVAIAHYNSWAALFAHRLPDGVVPPEWHNRDNEVLVFNIIRPLSQMRPELEGAALWLRAATVFAAVHGVIWLALAARFGGTPQELLSREGAALVDAMTWGVTA